MRAGYPPPSAPTTRAITSTPLANSAIRPASGAWNYPPGLPPTVFEPLTQLGMDAVQASDVALIQQLGQAWLAGGVRNQPIRMGDDLSCKVGQTTFADAKAWWMTLT